MTNDLEKLKSELVSLHSRKQELNSNNQRILTSLFHSRNAVDYLLGCITSLRNEIVGLITIAAGLTYSMKFQFKSLGNIKINDITDGSNEFQSLTKAYSGQDVSMPELKKEVIKAIDVLQSMTDKNDRLFEILSNTRSFLSEKE